MQLLTSCFSCNLIQSKLSKCTPLGLHFNNVYLENNKKSAVRYIFGPALRGLTVLKFSIINMNNILFCHNFSCFFFFFLKKKQFSKYQCKKFVLFNIQVTLST